MGRIVTPLPAPLPDDWPEPPAAWSPSALHAVEVCPRRWALQRAPSEAFRGRPFPRRPSAASVEGEAVHLAVERVLGALRTAGIASVRDPGVPAVLDELGRLPGIVRQASDDALAHAADNPRFEALGSRLRRDLDAAQPSLRATAQGVLAAVPEVPTSARAPRSGAALDAQRRPLGRGVYTEVALASSTLPLAGRADLVLRDAVGTRLVDVKSGRPSDAHADQLRLYGLAWLTDADRNPDRSPAASLALQYGTETVEVAPPASWDLFHADIANRLREATAAARDYPPAARTSIDRCPSCDVRAVCSAYRAAPTLWDHGGVFGDLVARVAEDDDPAALDAEAPDAQGHARPVRIRRDARWTLRTGSTYVILGVRSVPSVEGWSASPLFVPVATTEMFEVVEEGDAKAALLSCK